MFHNLESALLSLINTLPLELFVFITSFIEEVIAPVPSAAVLLMTGSFAAIQERTLLTIIPLAFIASTGKTIGAVVVYYFSDKIGNLVITKFGGFFDVSEEAIKNFGSKITGSSRDYLILIVFRALPIIPSSVVSIGCGLIKIPPRLFIITTFIGTILRDSVFLYIGFKGTEVLAKLATNSEDLESIVQLIILTIVVVTLGYFYYKRKRIK